MRIEGAIADIAARPPPGEACPAPSAATGSECWAEIVPAAEAFAHLGRHWAELARVASEPNAFAESWFVASGLRHLASADDIRMVLVWNETESGRLLVGLLPLALARHYGRIPVLHLQNWLHSQSFLGTPLVRAGRETAFWTSVLQALDQSPWARNFLHVCKLVESGPVHSGLVAAARGLGRPCDTALRIERALLDSDLSPQDYYERIVRKKKRKELKRLSSRLAELGPVELRRLGSDADLTEWCDTFLRLEKSGWKGDEGSALACSGNKEAFFREVAANALAAGKLDFLRLEVGGRPIAMLVNFLSPPGSFSFKIAFDEDYARFSPGVLIQIHNLDILDRADIRWMDSCAAADHPMINSLWAERRAIVRVTVPLKGVRRETVFGLCRLATRSSAALKRWRPRARIPDPEREE